MNKISKMKVHWQTYNHCLFVSYLASIAFRYGWISDANFRNSRIRIGYEYANSFRIWIRSWKINIRSHLLSKSRHSPKVFSNAKSKSKWSLKNLKNATFSTEVAAFLFHYLSPNPVGIQNFEVIYSPDPIQIQQTSYQWCSRDRNFRDETETCLKLRNRDPDFTIKAETETWKFETDTRDLTFLWW